MAPLPANAGADLPQAATDLRPYLAPLLLTRAAPASAAGYLADLAAEVSGAIVSSEGVERSAPTSTAVEVIGDLSVQTLQYVEASTPAWATRSRISITSWSLSP